MSKEMKISYITEEDIKKERLERAVNLTEDELSKYKWNGKPLYKIGHGHSFGRGFYIEYLTKDAECVTQYHDSWFNEGDEYKYNKETEIYEQVIIEKVEHKDIDFSNLNFPTVKNVKAKSIGMDLEPVKPIIPNKDE